MADVEEGKNPTPVDATARQTLAQLRFRLWSMQTLLTTYNSKTIDPPRSLRFLVMDKMEDWVRQDGARGEDTVYALVKQ